jgi:lipopolysaccharide export system permease protein
MLILSRYILRQHIGPFIFGFSVITLIWILNLLFKELNRILSKGLPPLVVLEFFALNLAWIVALTVPMATLIASLMAFGRLSADNEITAIKANGVSLYKILAPVLIVATMLSGFLVWFNNNVLPEFNHRLATLIRDIAQKKPALNIEAGVWYDELEPYGLIVSTIADSGGVSYVTDVLIRDNSNAEIMNVITAKHGIIRTNKTAGFLEIVLFEGEIQQLNIRRMEEFQSLAFPDSHIVRIDIIDQFLKRSESSYRSDREKSSAQLRQEITDLETEQSEKRRAVSLLGGMQFQQYFGSTLGLPLPMPADSTIMKQMLLQSRRRWGLNGQATYRSGRSPNSSNAKSQPASFYENRFLQNQVISEQRSVHSDVRNNLNQIKSQNNQINRYWVEVHKKYSIPIACIVFVLIGAPLGIKARKGSLGVGSGISLVFFLIYWSTLIAGEDLADRGIISPFLSMWLANFVVGAVGLYILYITVREIELMSLSKIAMFAKEKWGSVRKYLLLGDVEPEDRPPITRIR